MPKFFLKTYGCQMNERDSEQVAHSLMARGYERVGHESEADVVLLNTCSVRDMADQKALGKMGMLGRMAKERPHVVFGFLGCMAQARGAELLKNLPYVDLVVGTQKFHRVPDYLDELVAKAQTIKGTKVVVGQVEGLDRDGIRQLVDSLRQKLGSGVVVLGQAEDGKVALIAGVTKDLTPKIHAGKVIQTLAKQVNGRGGGRPDLAEGGGEDTSALNSTLGGVPTLLEPLL